MTTYAPAFVVTSRRRAEYALGRQYVGGLAVYLAGDFWAVRDTPRMWRLMHRTTPLNEFVAVGTITDVLDAWEQARDLAAVSQHTTASLERT